MTSTAPAQSSWADIVKAGRCGDVIKSGKGDIGKGVTSAEIGNELTKTGHDDTIKSSPLNAAAFEFVPEPSSSLNAAAFEFVPEPSTWDSTCSEASAPCLRFDAKDFVPSAPTSAGFARPVWPVPVPSSWAPKVHHPIATISPAIFAMISLLPDSDDEESDLDDESSCHDSGHVSENCKELPRGIQAASALRMLPPASWKPPSNGAAYSSVSSDGSTSEGEGEGGPSSSDDDSPSQAFRPPPGLCLPVDLRPPPGLYD